MPKWLSLATAVVFGVAACTQTSVVETTSGPTTTEQAEPEVSNLVVIDSNGNVVVVSSDGVNRRSLTDDGGAVVYAQPIWSPDSTRIAYTRITASDAGVGIHNIDDDTQAFVTMASPPFFSHWSPDGQNIGSLHNGARGIDFEMIDVGSGTTTVVDQGNPYYFSWDPDGGRVVVHEGESRFVIIAVDGTQSDLGTTDSLYLAPHWTDRGLIHVVGGDLVIEDSAGDRKPLAAVNGQTAFVANDEGNLVAIQTLSQAGGVTVGLPTADSVPPNVVSVLNVETGALEVIASEPAVGFWWSPDGKSLLIITATPDLQSLVASVWSSGSGVEPFATYRASPTQFREVFPFFPQYAQSMSFWSPDSSSFAIAGDIDGKSGVWVVHLDAEQAQWISDGVWVAWSS